MLKPIMLSIGLLWLSVLSSVQANPDPLLAQPPALMQQSQAVQVQTLPDGRWRAQLRYQEGKDSREYTFEGTPQDIQQQMQQARIPADKQQAVAQALTLQPGALFANVFGDGGVFGKDFPFGKSLLGGNDPFAQPFFQQDWLNDPFFQQFDKELDNLMRGLFAAPQFAPQPPAPQGLPPAQPQQHPQRQAPAPNSVWL